MTRIDNDKDGAENTNTELETVMNTKDEMSISQFIAAKKAAKQMIKFLRLKQLEAKEKLEQEQREKDLEKEKLNKQLEDTIAKNRGTATARQMREKLTMMQGMGPRSVKNIDAKP